MKFKVSTDTGHMMIDTKTANSTPRVARGISMKIPSPSQKEIDDADWKEQKKEIRRKWIEEIEEEKHKKWIDWGKKRGFGQGVGP